MTEILEYLGEGFNPTFFKYLVMAEKNILFKILSDKNIRIFGCSGYMKNC